MYVELVPDVVLCKVPFVLSRGPCLAYLNQYVASRAVLARSRLTNLVLTFYLSFSSFEGIKKESGHGCYQDHSLYEWPVTLIGRLFGGSSDSVSLPGPAAERPTVYESLRY